MNFSIAYDSYSTLCDYFEDSVVVYVKFNSVYFLKLGISYTCLQTLYIGWDKGRFAVVHMEYNN